ncbi:hypothetical protein F2Q70_00030092 [Brassica cretica]|uniref:Uncharacterized protein n=2 Tax=Brassica cretica TaxID=69181 RepID=A0A8S9H3J2_BRACR|nr:hypothetical protein F2Q70_00030092 [Brassica cretica]KAF2552633.1 hypothetical protein F2Q68_00034573 [Brassica cretica]KAF3484864.1 hypothetical protein F2Q69_00053356 [Brassica cretica]KAF3592446.1 hypothetical protein DY000_02022406 [Brassica cretica]
MEDKQKEIIGIDDSQLSGGVDINLSLAQSSATSYTISHEVIDEFDNHQPSLRIWLVPEREKSKETEASFPQAWSMIDFPNVKTSLDEAEGSALRLVRLIDYFASAFSGVSFASEDISKDPLSSTLDYKKAYVRKRLRNLKSKVVEGDDLNNEESGEVADVEWPLEEE